MAISDASMPAISSQPSFSSQLSAATPAPGQLELELFALASSGDKSRLKKLLRADKKRKVHVNWKWPQQRGQTALFAACANGRTGAAELLIDAQADVNATEDGGWTPLCVAAGRGDVPTAKLLLNRGASVDQTTRNGKHTPLYFATRNGKSLMVALLLERKASHDARNKDGETATFIAASVGRRKALGALLAGGADPNAQDAQGNTPLFSACWNGNEGIVADLLRAKADIEHTNKAGMTPIFIASMFGRQDAVETLLGQNARVNRADQRGRTPLHIACRKDRISTVEMLISGGANVNARDVRRHTPLIEAAYANAVDVARSLLGARAEPLAENKMGKTAEAIAKERGYAHLANLLSKAAQRSTGGSASPTYGRAGSPTPRRPSLAEALREENASDKKQEAKPARPAISEVALKRLISSASSIKQNAMCKHSGYQVGAALLTADGQTVQGINVESDSYGMCICAERVALCNALTAGHRAFQAMVVATKDGGTCCGACRQMLVEYMPDAPVIFVDGQCAITGRMTPRQMAPNAFVLEQSPPQRPNAGEKKA